MDHQLGRRCRRKLQRLRPIRHPRLRHRRPVHHHRHRRRRRRNLQRGQHPLSHCHRGRPHPPHRRRRRTLHRAHPPPSPCHRGRPPPPHRRDAAVGRDQVRRCHLHLHHSLRRQGIRFE